MSLWLVVVLATATGGALVLWHQVSKLKHNAEDLLDKYAELLAASREQRRKKLLEEAERQAENLDQVEAAERTSGGTAP
jgi:uncharacterized protein HemX